jgi:CBS domain-containing protein
MFASSTAEGIMRKLSDVILEQRPLIMNETASVLAACERMRDCQAGSVLVTGDDGRLVGIFTGRDAVCRVLAQGRDAATTRLADAMTAKPSTMSPDETAIDAMRLMWDGGFRHVPLVKNGKILGVVSRGDFKGIEHTRHEDERDLWEHMR